MIPDALKFTIEPHIDNSPQGVEVRNPATGGLLARLKNQGVDDALAAVDRAEAAFGAWSGMTAKARSLILKKWYDLIVHHSEDLALLVTREQGRVLKETRGEALYAASFVEWFAEEAKRAYGRTIPETVEGKTLMTLKLPVGVCAAITPWNFPLSMITRKVAPALAAGCTVVIKPSEETPLSAMALQGLALKAGLPQGVMEVVITNNAQGVGQVLTKCPKIAKFSFTGSTMVGKHLYAQCADTIKKVSLELGGNAPFIIFDDADMAAALEGVLASKFRNSGQTCVCANRIFVQTKAYDAFVNALKARMEALIMTDGERDDADLGPLINKKAVDKIKALVLDAHSNGAHLMEAKVDHEGGSFYPATIVSGVTPQMALFAEEIFGPVASMIRFETEDEVIEMANSTPYGLAAYAFTKDIGRAMRLTRKLNYGMVGINDGLMSTEVAPFGGVKQSGIGREGASEGLEEYLSTRFVSFGKVN